MVPSLVKLVLPAMLICLLPFVFSTERVEIDCDKIYKKSEPCPSYCPKGSRPKSLNPNNLWGIPCVCCTPDSSQKPDDHEEHGVAGNKTFKAKMVFDTRKPQEVPEDAKKRMNNKLATLAKLKKLPPKEYSYWVSRMELIDDDLLSPDEEELLISLMVDCGVSWTTAFFLVRPLAEKQIRPAPSRFGMRAGFLGHTEKPFLLNDLRLKLENVDISKVGKTAKGAVVDAADTL